MNFFLLDPGVIPTITLLILTFAFILYLTSVKEKSAANWWLRNALFGLALLWTGSLFMKIFSPEFYTLEYAAIIIAGLTFLGIGIAIWAFNQFSYQFLKNPFQKEYKWISAGSGIVLALFFTYMLYVLFGNIFQMGSFMLLFSIMVLCFSLWSTVVLIRKYRHSKRDENDRERKAYRNFILLYTLILLYIIQIGYRFATMQYPTWLEISITAVSLVMIFGIAVTYLNYSQEPISLQVKLVGYSLVVGLGIFSLSSTLFFSENHSQVTSNYSITFTAKNDGYSITETSSDIDFSDLGQPLNMGDDVDEKVNLPFTMPFSDSTWSEIYISPNGAISFGHPIYIDGIAVTYPKYLFNSVPKVFPVYQDFNPQLSGSVYAKSDTTKATITWKNVVPFGRENETNTFQAILHQNGNVEFNYGEINTNRSPQLQTYGFAGVVPGRGASKNLIQTLQDTGSPDFIKSNQSFIRTIGIKEHLETHEFVKKLVFTLFGFLAFILLFSPIFFRESILKPIDKLLEGVRQVNKGKTDTQIPVAVKDEVGYLTSNFNKMAKSLQAYHAEMEDLVAHRTKELEIANEELQRSLEELKAAQNQLVQQEKLASLGQLTAGIAHEIKNPLNFVNNFSDLSVELVEEAREELSALSPQPSEALKVLDDVETNLRKIHEHGSRADSIVKSMLQHSRGGSGKMEPTDINALVKEYVNLAFHGMRAGKNPINVDIELQLDEKVEKVPLIAEDFSRIVLNLCNNGFDAMREKLSAISSQPSASYKPKLTVRTKTEDGKVVVEIEDNGPGVPEEMKEKILQPFFTTKKGTEGTGLGLSITNDIVKAHGGSLLLESKPDAGTTCSIYLKN